MAKRRSPSRKSSKCPEPFNTLIDLAGAAALGAFVKSQVKRDYAKGQGEASAKAAMAVFGAGAFRKGSAGLVNLGGLIGLNSALKDIEQRPISYFTANQGKGSAQASSKPSTVAKPIRKNLWREHSEDGSEFGLDPKNYESPDDYVEALNAAKSKSTCTGAAPLVQEDDSRVEKENVIRERKHVWRDYCTDGTPYGLNPENFDSADDYEEAIEEAKEKTSSK